MHLPSFGLKAPFEGIWVPGLQNLRWGVCALQRSGLQLDPPTLGWRLRSKLWHCLGHCWGCAEATGCVHLCPAGGDSVTAAETSKPGRC